MTAAYLLFQFPEPINKVLATLYKVKPPISKTKMTSINTRAN